MSRLHDSISRVRSASRRRLACEWLAGLAPVASLAVLHRSVLVPTLVGCNVAIGGWIVAVRSTGRSRRP